MINKRLITRSISRRNHHILQVKDSENHCKSKYHRFYIFHEFDSWKRIFRQVKMFKNISVTFYILHVRKGTTSGISSDLLYKDGNACPIYNGTLKSFVWSSISLILMWIVFNCGFSTKITCALLLQEDIEELFLLENIKELLELT